MLAFAPRLEPRLLDEIERLAERRLPIAELNRRVGAVAARMGLFRPSYERVRSLVHVARRLRGRGRTSFSTAVVFRTRGPRELVDRASEPRAPRLRGRAPPK